MAVKNPMTSDFLHSAYCGESMAHMPKASAFLRMKPTVITCLDCTIHVSLAYMGEFSRLH